MLGCMGTLPFVAGQGTLFSPSGISKSLKNSWARHKVINSVDVLEDTGFQPTSITIEMKFFKPWTHDPASSLSQLEKYAQGKVPMPVMIGNTPLGRGGLTMYVVESVDAKMEKWNGSTLTILHVSVKLEEFSTGASPLFNFISAPIGAASSFVSSIGLPGPVRTAVSTLGRGLI